MTNEDKKDNIRVLEYKLYKVETKKSVQQYLAVGKKVMIFGSINKIHKELYGY